MSTVPKGARALPTFFVIGAAKAGTTSLHHYLDLHPEIQMSVVKEPGFFAGPENGHPYPKGRISRLEDYEALFDPTVAVRGESSPNYSMDPIRVGVPERIGEMVPSARFVYVVRDPVQRTISHHMHAMARGDERRPLEEVLTAGNDPRQTPQTCMSLYACQFERYLRRYDADRVLVIDQDDLRSSREQALREVFRFLSVDPEYSTEGFAAELYASNKRRRYPPGYESVVGSALGPRLRWIPRGVRRAARSSVERLLFRAVQPPAVDAQLQERLMELFAPDVERLRQLTGKPFASWCV